MPSAYDRNEQAWDERVRRKMRHTARAAEKHISNPMRYIDPFGWLDGNIQGRKTLCLASGGGYQSIVHAAAGADVTVVDISERMLEQDRKIAERFNLRVTTVQASMDDLSSLPTGHFELITQPVSTCYVADIRKVHAEVARVAAPGALYISQHKQPASLQASAVPGPSGYWIEESYYRSGPLPPAPICLHRESDTVEFLHRWEDLVGGLCQSGFALEDLREPNHSKPNSSPGTYGHRSGFLPPYVILKARRNMTRTEEPRILVVP